MSSPTVATAEQQDDVWRRRRRSAATAGAGLLAVALAIFAGPEPDAAADAGPPRQQATSACTAGGTSDNQALGPSFALPAWADAAGWKRPASYGTILTADFDGDNVAELLGRSAAGLEIWEFDTTTGQWFLPKVNGRWHTTAGPRVGPTKLPLSDANGWDDESRALTIQAANLDGQGGKEILARGADGMHAWTYHPDTGVWEELPAGPPLWDKNNWNQQMYYSSIQTGDIDGDGADDIVSRGGGGVTVYRWDKDKRAWKAPLDGPAWSDAAGWNRPSFYRTIRVGKLYGNGRTQLFGRTSAGLEAWDYDPASSKWTSTQPDTGDRWSDSNPPAFDKPEHYATIKAADIDGDNRDEIIGRGSDGIRVAKYASDKPAWLRLEDVGTEMVLPDRPNDLPSYYETLQVYRPTEKGRPLLMVRGADGVELYEFSLNESNNYAWSKAGTGPTPALSDANGWAGAEKALTIQSADVDGTKSVDGGTTNEIIARDSVGMRTWTVERDSTTHLLRWVPTSVSYPSTTSREQAAALNWVEDHLNLADDQHLRCQYGKPGNVSTLNGYRTDLDKMSPPQGVDSDTWNALRDQLDQELTAAVAAQDFFAAARQQLVDTTQDEELAVGVVKGVLSLKDDDQVSAELAGAFAGMVEGMVDAVPLEGAILEAGQLMLAGAVGGAMDTAMGDDLGGRVDSSYTAVLSALDTNLTETKAAFNTNLADVAGDWGLMHSLGKLDASGATKLTPNETNAAAASARRAFDEWVWQTLTPSTWEVVALKCSSEAECRRNYSGRYLYVADGRSYFLTVPSIFNPHEPNQDQEDHLFLPTDAHCLSTAYSWQLIGDKVQGCSLGVPVENVMRGLNGWHLPCSGDGCAVTSRQSTPASGR